MWLLWTIGILLLLGAIPVGVRAVYDGDMKVWLTVLGIRFRLYPSKGGKKSAPKKAKAKKKENKKRPDLNTLKDYLRLVAELLGHLRRKITVRTLTLHAIFGGEDEADAALNYGRAWAAIGIVAPLLDACFRIKKRDMGAFRSQDEKSFRLYAEAHATLTVGRTLQILLKALLRFIKIYKNKQPEKAV